MALGKAATAHPNQQGKTGWRRGPTIGQPPHISLDQARKQRGRRPETSARPPAARRASACSYPAKKAGPITDGDQAAFWFSNNWFMRFTKAAGSARLAPSANMA